MGTEDELRHFETLYDMSYDPDDASLTDTWESQADKWDRKYRAEEERELHEVRIRDTAAWLRAQGLLGPEQDVADVGCGPGRYAAEFARTARSVMGTDISPKMTEYGEAFCREQGLRNVSFRAVDFHNADVEALGWAGRFDLAYSSITPAVSGLKGLDNFIAISRAWCFNASYVYSVSPLHADLMQDLFGRPPRRDRSSHAHSFYELFSLLWLRGYYPMTHYYKQYREIRITADRDSAGRMAGFLLKKEEVTEDNIERIRRYLEDRADASGHLTDASECWFGWLLWDVRDRKERRFPR